MGVLFPDNNLNIMSSINKCVNHTDANELMKTTDKLSELPHITLLMLTGRDFMLCQVLALQSQISLFKVEE